MINQLQFGADGVIKDKVETAIARLKAFEPPEGYYVAFSGGKNSQCVYHLCKMAGVKFDAHYNVTSVDPPELVQFIKKNYPDVAMDVPHDKDGKRVSMWSLIEKKLMPPTRVVRYCCEQLKEANGEGRVTVTGVRWAESANRRLNQGVVTIPKRSKRIAKDMKDMGINFTQSKSGGVILNYDDASERRTAEYCMRTGRMIVNPIVDWEDEDVWEFLNGNGIEHCCLYNQGFTRLGCIGCPLGGTKSMKEELTRYPKYKKMYLNAFKKMIAARAEKGMENWNTPEEVMAWWLKEDKSSDQL